MTETTDQFHRFIRRRTKAVVAFVLLAEQLGEVGRKPFIGQPHLDLARLPDIAGLGGKPELLPLRWKTIARQPLRAGGDEFVQHRRDPRMIGLVDAHAQAARRVMLGIGNQQSERAEHAGQRRHDHAR